MARLHLINDDAVSPIKCIKCECLLLAEPCNATSDLMIWHTSDFNCEKIKAPPGKPTQPIQSSKF